MNPRDYKDEQKFKELCFISTQLDLEQVPVQAPVSIVSAAERLSAIDKQRAIEEARTGKLIYCLFCVDGQHFRCVSQLCGCSCRDRKENEPSKETSSGTSSPAFTGYQSDPYWKDRIASPVRMGGAVGTSLVGAVGWRGGRNDESATIGEEISTGNLTVVHKAGEMLNPVSTSHGDSDLSARIDRAFERIAETRKQGRWAEAARLARMVSHSGVKVPDSNWKAATTAIQTLGAKMREPAETLDQPSVAVETLSHGGSRVIHPSRIQLTPFPCARRVIIVDDAGTAVHAYIPAEETL